MSLSLMATLAHAINARRISALGRGQLADHLPNVLVDIVLDYVQPSAEDHFAAVSATGQVIKQDLICFGQSYSIHFAAGPIAVATFGTGQVDHVSLAPTWTDDTMAEQISALFGSEPLIDDVSRNRKRHAIDVAANAMGWLATSYARVARNMPATF